MGRPTSFRPEFVEQAEKLCRLGATDAQMADFFDVCEDTINNWKIEHPEFFVSIKRGKLESDANVADRLYHRAMGYSHDAVKIFMPSGSDKPVYAPYTEHYAPDTTAMIFWLKNRQPGQWRDKTENKTTVAVADPIKELMREISESGTKIYDPRPK
jgi:hypothetical protein